MRKLLIPFFLFAINAIAHSQVFGPTQVNIDSKFMEAGRYFLPEVGVNLDIPTGQWKESYNLGVGGSITARYLFSSAVSIQATISFDHFSAKSVPISISPGKNQSVNMFAIVPALCVTMLSNLSLIAGGGYSSTSSGSQSLGAFLWRGALSQTFRLNQTPVGIQVGYNSATYDHGSNAYFDVRIFITLARPIINE
jgi:hypothetical protein